MTKDRFIALLEPYATEIYSRPYSGPRQGLDWPMCFKLDFKKTEGQTVFTRTRDGAFEVFATGKAADIVSGLIGLRHEIRPNSTGQGRETLYSFWTLSE